MTVCIDDSAVQQTHYVLLIGNERLYTLSARGDNTFRLFTAR